MSREAREWAKRQRGLSQTAHHVLAILSDLSSSQSPYRTIEQLADDCDCGRTAVWEAVRSLSEEDPPLLQVDRKRAHGAFTYTLLLGNTRVRQSAGKRQSDGCSRVPENGSLRVPENGSLEKSRVPESETRVPESETRVPESDTLPYNVYRTEETEETSCVLLSQNAPAAAADFTPSDAAKTDPPPNPDPGPPPKPKRQRKPKPDVTPEGQDASKIYHWLVDGMVALGLTFGPLERAGHHVKILTALVRKHGRAEVVRIITPRKLASLLGVPQPGRVSAQHRETPSDLLNFITEHFEFLANAHPTPNGHANGAAPPRIELDAADVLAADAARAALRQTQRDAARAGVAP